MFEDYAAEVLRGYEQRRAGGTLSTNLMHPTPAKLKRECLVIFDQRYHKKDEFALSSFFDPRDSKEAYRLAAKKHEADKFRPLNMVLNSGLRKTDEKNIELLAWLIDYQPRPYVRWTELNADFDKINVPVDPPAVPESDAQGQVEFEKKVAGVTGR